MDSTMILVLLLSLALAVVSLFAIRERRQRRGLQLLLHRFVNPSIHRETANAKRTRDTDGSDRAANADDRRVRQEAIGAD